MTSSPGTTRAGDNSSLPSFSPPYAGATARAATTTASAVPVNGRALRRIVLAPPRVHVPPPR
ncbi:hypothetical protein STRIP9103_09738 [Streptomyces ipomoeae 91-03]|uniref:Uncharacterized protein n=1 Tax=Streptomyces ipomoeae 91-03 TaxID=698759 RepID=L1KUX9_9ACTN|nr:hypothetical protein STRIP9103_09738 [Streptomyces ipomoeae 91-03]